MHLYNSVCVCVCGEGHYLSVLQVDRGEASRPVLIISNKLLSDQLIENGAAQVCGHCAEEIK